MSPQHSCMHVMHEVCLAMTSAQLMPEAEPMQVIPIQGRHGDANQTNSLGLASAGRASSYEHRLDSCCGQVSHLKYIHTLFRLVKHYAGRTFQLRVKFGHCAHNLPQTPLCLCDSLGLLRRGCWHLYIGEAGRMQLGITEGCVYNYFVWAQGRCTGHCLSRVLACAFLAPRPGC